MRIPFILIIIFSISHPLFSQENTILRGEIRGDSLKDSFIHILNLSQETGTISSFSGEFEIEVKKNDTLAFSSIQHNIVKVKISKRILDAGFLEVEMSENINQLEEVIINNYNLTGILQQDLSKKKPFNQANVGFPLSYRESLTPIERRLKSARDGLLVTLWNSLSGRIKKLEKARKKEKTSIMLEKEIAIVSSNFFTKDLQIPEDEIFSFVYFCARYSQFRDLIFEGRRLELIEYYQKMAPQFLSQKQKM